MNNDIKPSYSAEKCVELLEFLDGNFMSNERMQDELDANIYLHLKELVRLQNQPARPESEALRELQAEMLETEWKVGDPCFCLLDLEVMEMLYVGKGEQKYFVRNATWNRAVYQIFLTRAEAEAYAQKPKETQNEN